MPSIVIGILVLIIVALSTFSYNLISKQNQLMADFDKFNIWIITVMGIVKAAKERGEFSEATNIAFSHITRPNFV